MKELYLVRHAKSSWTSGAATDFARPLNPRGEKSAPFMAELLLRRSVNPELFISSPANRALTTARYFIAAYGRSPDEIQQEETLYPGNLNGILSVIQKVPDTYRSVILFGHNPGMTDAVNRLGRQYIPNLPTAGIAGFKIETDRWSSILEADRKVVLLEFPKTYKAEWA